MLFCIIAFSRIAGQVFFRIQSYILELVMVDEPLGRAWLTMEAVPHNYARSLQ